MPIRTNKAPVTYAPPHEPTYAQWIAEQMQNYADATDKPVPAVDISGRTRRQKLVNMKKHPPFLLGVQPEKPPSAFRTMIPAQLG